MDTSMCIELKKLKNNGTKKQNKSSIVRVIISNFDNKSVKEIKILYKKQGGVDTLLLDNEPLNFKSLESDNCVPIKFHVVSAYNKLEEDEYIEDNLNEDFKSEINTSEEFKIRYEENNNKVIVTKYKFNKLYKEYSVSGYYKRTKDNKIKVIVTVEDNLLIKETDNLKIRDSNRRKISSTERILLDEDTIKYYERIMDDKNIFIDSKEIYKVNRFLDYRSNMLLYFQVINNVIVKEFMAVNNKLGNQIYNIQKKAIDKDYIKLANDIKENKSKYLKIVDFINNHNANLEKEFSKEKISKKEYEHRKININEGEIKEDLKKILELLSNFRHSLMHYNYKYYGDLYSGNDYEIEDVNKGKNIKISELLDLNLFDYLKKVRLNYTMIKSNYLDDSTEISVLGKKVNAKKLLSRYYNICDRKNGFNKFINYNLDKFIEEDDETRKFLVDNYFDYLKKFIEEDDETILKREYKELIELFGEDRIYLNDIHSSSEYKRLYNRRKELVQKNQIQIEIGNKDEITKLNSEILKINKQMKHIAELNSKYRLLIKMQFAFGYLSKNYGLENKDISKFKDEFEINDNLRNLSKEDFLNIMLDTREEKIVKFVDGYEFENGQFQDENSMFFKDKSNNLVKFYILIFNLLPRELRGDFLGFVKKNYYDVKHIGLLEGSSGEKKDTFFHNIRLFEKNIKRLEIINYNFLDVLDIETSNIIKDTLENTVQNLVASVDVTDSDKKEIMDKIDKNQFPKAIILPIMKYYQIVFKLINSVEIELLYKLMKMKSYNSFEDAMRSCEDKNGYYNFRNLLNNIGINTSNGEINDFINLRNSIAHLNEKELFFDRINLYVKDLKPISKRLESGYYEIIQEIKDDVDFCNSIDIKLNDFYMKKEQLLNNLKLDISDSKKIRIENTDRERNKLLVDYFKDYIVENKNIENLKEEIKAMDFIIKNDKKNKDVRKKRKSKKNDLKVLEEKLKEINGRIISIFIRNIKLVPFDIIRNGESRYIKCEVYDKLNKRTTMEEMRFIYELDGNSYLCNLGTLKIIKDKKEQENDGFREIDELTSEELGEIKIEANFKNINIKKSSVIEFYCKEDKKKPKANINLDKNYIQKIKFIINK